jgi:glutaminase
MHQRLHSDAPETPSTVSTGVLPAASIVQSSVREAFERYRSFDEGTVATFIPALARVRRESFGVCVVGTDGATYSAGDRQHAFTLQSVAKPFVFALVCQALGGRQARDSIGVNSTGLPFDSIMAIELHAQRTVNPMVNAGALATASLAPGADVEAKWRFIREGLSRFAGRALELDMDVYRCEAATNHRNRGIASLLASYGRMYCDPHAAVEIYTRQCALEASVEDLAVMGATLADGGVNPRTRERIIDASGCQRVLAVLATAGLYEQSGDWLYEVGLPAKSGVSGGIVAVAAGKAGLASFSPPLDEAGNSCRGQLALRFLSERLGLNLFASQPAA